MANHKLTTAPTSPTAKQKSPSDLWTTATTTATTGWVCVICGESKPADHYKLWSADFVDVAICTNCRSEQPTFNDKALRVLVWLCVLTWAVVGVLIGVVFVLAWEPWLQFSAAAAYLVIGLLGWLPWQIGRNHESN